ncbi:hypothetical protein KCP77_16555 [Salmonella enterica subsp. enterica]|nr:hypothetical protein KCP77_16555 [Salmonella enterica subsp. enterica]
MKCSCTLNGADRHPLCTVLGYRFCTVFWRSYRRKRYVRYCAVFADRSLDQLTDPHLWVENIPEH